MGGQLTPEERRSRWDELCTKLESLVREYGDCIASPEWSDDLRPDWHHPLSLQHWVLIFAVDDDKESERGFFTFSVNPWDQRPYITEGLVSFWQNLYQNHDYHEAGD